jgi:hypothetical protein
MTVEVASLVPKEYTMEYLVSHWLPLVIKGTDHNLDGIPNRNSYEEDSANYDIVYTIQEEDTSDRYAYLYFKSEIGGDNHTIRYTLEKIVVDKKFKGNVATFFENIVGSLTANTSFEYRLRIDKIDTHLSRKNYENTIREATNRFEERVNAKIEDRETDLALTDIGIIQGPLK